jgi:hypothetical protein
MSSKVCPAAGGCIGSLNSVNEPAATSPSLTTGTWHDATSW